MYHTSNSSIVCMFQVRSTHYVSPCILLVHAYCIYTVLRSSIRDHPRSGHDATGIIPRTWTSVPPPVKTVASSGNSGSNMVQKDYSFFCLWWQDFLFPYNLKSWLTSGWKFDICSFRTTDIRYGKNRKERKERKKTPKNSRQNKGLCRIHFA